jgi:saccharopine dehydrogenase-like NADP-dependent oxidoreductase
MGRYFGDKFDSVESMEFSYAYAHLGGAKSFFPFDPKGVIGQYTMSPVILRDGELVRVPPRHGRRTEVYPDPIGIRDTFYIFHSEPICFAKAYEDKGLKNAGTKAGWGPEFLDKLEFLDSLGLLDVNLRRVGDVSVAPAEVLVSGLRRDETAKTQDYGCFRLVIKGEKSGEKLEYTGEVFTGPYKNLSGTQHRTGIPAAIAVRMLGRGDITHKGAFSPEFGVDPKIYFRELERRQIPLYYTVRHYA